MRRILLAAFLALAALFAGDYLRLRCRGGAFGVIQVRRYYAVVLKNRKTEYMFEEPKPRACVHSLFPHYGETPCWYLERHKLERVEIDSGPPPALF